MPLLDVRGRPGVVLAALHLLPNRTPPDEALKAFDTESGPIHEFRHMIPGFKRARIRDVTLATGIHKEFRHFPFPSRSIRPHGPSDVSARIRVAFAKRRPCRDPAVPCDSSRAPLALANGAPRTPSDVLAVAASSRRSGAPFRVCCGGHPDKRTAQAFPGMRAGNDMRRGGPTQAPPCPVRYAAALWRSAQRPSSRAAFSRLPRDPMCIGHRGNRLPFSMWTARFTLFTTHAPTVGGCWGRVSCTAP